MGYDMNDLAKDGGPAAVRALLERAAPPLPEDHPAPAFTKPDPPPHHESPPIEPPHEDDEETTLGKRLAAMGDIEYDRQRENKAKELGIRVQTLDKLRNRFLPKSQTDLPGTAIDLYEPIPWPTPVNASMIFEEVYRVICKHMVIPHEYAIIITFWIVHAHLFDVFSHTPRLIITAPDSECGKSLLAIHLIGNLVPKPQPTENLNPAVFYRIIEQSRPTILGDEMDELLKQDPALIGGINGGWEPHGGALRCVGDNHEVRKFSTYAPCLLAGVKIHSMLPNTTLSRSFIVPLERAHAGETFVPFDEAQHQAELREIGRKLARWCLDHRERIRQTRPQLPEGARNRKADKWRPFFALAEIAGGEWPQRATQAYKFEEGEETNRLSKELQLLSDIREVMRENESFIYTHVLITRLCELEESPWLEYNFKAKDAEDRKIKPRQISNMVREYKVRPDDVGPPGGKKLKGYSRAKGAYALEPAWRRYLKPKANTPPTNAEVF